MRVVVIPVVLALAISVPQIGASRVALATVTDPRNQPLVDAVLDRLADRLTSEMLIEYLVPVGSKPNDVKVGVRIAGARVRGLGVAPR